MPATKTNHKTATATRKRPPTATRVKAERPEPKPEPGEDAPVEKPEPSGIVTLPSGRTFDPSTQPPITLVAMNGTAISGEDRGPAWKAYIAHHGLRFA